ncbi:MAG: transglutaminase-like domain-containing protein [Polyangiaceae bacterium]|nr:transglutaminase-like domain-containing protein [Polyangiaceae bacterium]
MLAASLVVYADVPPVVLHEFIPPDPSEDVRMAATTADGRLPAAMSTPSGAVLAPDTSRMPTSTEHAYGSTASSVGENKYNPDRDTRRPAVNRYDDPFTPATSPYKRLRAFDWVAEDFTLTVATPEMSPVSEGGSLMQGEDGFFADMTVDLVAGEPVRIPTVGPGSRVVSRTMQPQLVVALMKDGADNWFALGTSRTRVRLVMQLAVSRKVFGGEFGDAVLGEKRRLPSLPWRVAESVDEVVRTLGLAGERSARSAVTSLVGYFRAFEPSDDPPSGRQNIYLDLALSRKGVCRHRAYAFVVTALGLGIPSRMVHNEAHAWVEVHDGASWKRIDLGGASTNLTQDEAELARPQHRGASDPFPWPPNSGGEDSGRMAAARTASGGGSTSSGDGGRANVGDLHTQYSYQDPSVSSRSLASSLTSPSSSVANQVLGAASMTVLHSESLVFRGGPLKVQGMVAVDSYPCSHVRVNVYLRDPRTMRSQEIGALSTDESGRFSGAVVVPLDVKVGEYDLVVATPGDGRCGSGTSGP